jgi:hypothetical protein
MTYRGPDFYPTINQFQKDMGYYIVAMMSVGYVSLGSLLFAPAK